MRIAHCKRDFPLSAAADILIAAGPERRSSIPRDGDGREALRTSGMSPPLTG